MKPHFGQSDAAMNKLAGCNKFPNAGKGLEQIAELEAKAKDAGFETPLEYVRVKHTKRISPISYENGYEDGFEKGRLSMQPAKNITSDMTPELEGYYGHHNGCDCAVCEQCAWDESQKKVEDQEFNKLLDDNAELWRCVINYRDTLEKIAIGTKQDLTFTLENVQELARVTLAIGHKPR